MLCMLTAFVKPAGSNTLRLCFRHMPDFVDLAELARQLLEDSELPIQLPVLQPSKDVRVPAMAPLHLVFEERTAVARAAGLAMTDDKLGGSFPLESTWKEELELFPPPPTMTVI